MEQMNMFLSPDLSKLEELENVKLALTKLRKSFFKRYEVEMEAINGLEKRLVDLENAPNGDRVHDSLRASPLECSKAV